MCENVSGHLVAMDESVVIPICALFMRFELREDIPSGQFLFANAASVEETGILSSFLSSLPVVVSGDDGLSERIILVKNSGYFLKPEARQDGDARIPCEVVNFEHSSDTLTDQDDAFVVIVDGEHVDREE